MQLSPKNFYGVKTPTKSFLPPLASKPVCVTLEILKGAGFAVRLDQIIAAKRRFDPNTPCTYSAGVAQLVEQLICNQQVAGSSPIVSFG